MEVQYNGPPSVPHSIQVSGWSPSADENNSSRALRMSVSLGSLTYCPNTLVMVIHSCIFFSTLIAATVRSWPVSIMSLWTKLMQRFKKPQCTIDVVLGITIPFRCFRKSVLQTLNPSFDVVKFRLPTLGRDCLPPGFRYWFPGLQSSFGFFQNFF